METTEKTNDIFISYRRSDVDFTKKIQQALKQAEFTVWVDWDDIPPGVEGFTDEIQHGIEGSVAFICILSPSYLESPYCLMELREAIRLKKRIIPVVLKKFEPTPAPEGIGHINWVYFTSHAGQENTFEESFPKVIQAIQADYEHARQHRKLLQRAIDWQKNDKAKGYVMKGAELERAEHWQVAASDKDPTPTELHSEYILASRTEEKRRQRNTLIGVTVALVVSVVLGVMAVLQRQEAIRQEKEAIRQAEIALSRQLAAQAQTTNLGRNANQSVSVLLAAQSLKISPSNEAASLLINDNFAGIPIASTVHAAGPSAFAASPNGWYVATAVCDIADDESTVCSIQVREAATGREVINIPNVHEGWVNTIDMSPDGNRIVSGSEDGTACIWETATGANIACIPHSSSVSIVKFSPDGKYVGSVNGREVDISSHVWDAATGQEVANLPEDGNVRSLAFSPDSTQLVTGAWANVHVWDIASGTSTATMSHDSESAEGEVIFTPDIASIAFSPDGKYVLSGSWDRTARVWDIAAQTEVARMTHDLRVRAVAFSPFGSVAASTSEDGIIRVWNVSGGDETARMVHNGIVEQIIFSPDGKYLLSQSLDNTARVWDVSTGKEVARMMHEGGVGGVAFSPDGNYVISTGGEGTVRVWKVANSMTATHLIHNESVHAFAFSRDGKYVALGANWGDIRVLELTSGREVATMNDDSNHISSLAFSPNGKYVVSGSADKRATVWDAFTGEEFFTVAHDQGEYGDEVTATFSKDGKYVITHGGDYTVRTWDATTGQEVEHNDFGGQAVIFSADGLYLAAHDQDGSLQVLDHDGKELARMKQEEALALRAISPDGRYVATSGTLNNTVHVWEVSTGTQIASMIHDSPLEAIAFSPVGPYLATGENDRTGHIWDVLTGKEVARITGNSVIYTIGFSPDGRYLVSGGCDLFFTKYCVEGSLRMWTWQSEDLISNACSVMLRNLSRAEWEQYIGNAKPYEAICTNLPLDGEIMTLTRDAPLAFEKPEPITLIEQMEIPIDLSTGQEASPIDSADSSEASATDAVALLAEEFDGTMGSWTSFMTSGIEKQLDTKLESGRLLVQLSPYEDKVPRAYWISEGVTYADVKVEAVMTNNGNNANGVSLICQYNDLGWYELNISNAGLYSIYAFDIHLFADERYILLASGGSPAIKTGQVTNTYAAVCKGDELSLYVNGTLVKTVQDKILNFTEGSVGFGASSPQMLPVEIQFDSVLAGVPEN